MKYDDASWEVQKENYQDEIKRKGEEVAKKAGSTLDVSTDGYYNTQKCIADFEKVSFFAKFSSSLS